MSAAEERTRAQMAKEIERRVKDSVKACFDDMLRSFDLVPKATSNEPPLIDRRDIATDPLAGLVREIRNRIAEKEVISSRDNSNDQPQNPERSMPAVPHHNRVNSPYGDATSNESH